MGFSSLSSPSLFLNSLAFSAFSPKSPALCFFPLSENDSQRLALISGLPRSFTKPESGMSYQPAFAKANTDAPRGLFSQAVKRSSWASSAPRATPQESSGGAGSDSEVKNVPEWAKPDSNVPPPWAREKSSSCSGGQSFEPPFYVYLIGSSLVAIAAVGSIFEFFNKRPIFDIIQQDSPFYTPILGFFAITGFPSSAFLFYKSVQLANKLSQEQDREDGFSDG